MDVEVRVASLAGDLGWALLPECLQKSCEENGETIDDLVFVLKRLYLMSREPAIGADGVKVKLNVHAVRIAIALSDVNKSAPQQRKARCSRASCCVSRGPSGVLSRPSSSRTRAMSRGGNYADPGVRFPNTSITWGSMLSDDRL